MLALQNENKNSLPSNPSFEFTQSFSVKETKRKYIYSNSSSGSFSNELYSSNELQKQVILNCSFEGMDKEDEENVDAIRKLQEVFRELHNGDYKYILKVEKFEFNIDDKYLRISFKQPHLTTLNKYLRENNPYIDEFLYSVYCLFKAYFECCEVIRFEEYQLKLSSTDVSLVVVREDSSPYLRLCISPYAFAVCLSEKTETWTEINDFDDDSDEYEDELPSVDLSFADIFEEIQVYYNDNYTTIVNANFDGDERYTRISEWLDEIIKELKERKASCKEFLENRPLYKFLTDIYSIKQMPFRTEPIIIEENKEKPKHGTYGYVMKVKYQEDPNTIYALKQNTENYIAELQREAFILNTINHPNVVRMLGYSEIHYDIVNQTRSRELYGYMLMEYCPYSLHDVYINIYETYKYNLDILLYYIKIIYGQIFTAISYIHTHKRYVHRDLKFNNILLTQLQPYPHIKICDFGFCRTSDSKMNTNSGSDYINDLRIIKNEPYDDRCDAFALGCIMYKLLTDCYPLELLRNINSSKGLTRSVRSSLPEYMQRIQQKELEYPCEIANHPILINYCQYTNELLLSQQYCWENVINASITMDCVNYYENVRNETIQFLQE